MCLIIDTNVLMEMLDSNGAMGKLIRRWLLYRGGFLAEGGELSREWKKIGVAQSTLTELRRAGRVFDASIHNPLAFQEALERYSGKCKSNDAHILAVAHISGARTLATHDQLLTDDFKNPKLLPSPRGRVLHDESQKHLLRHDVGCRNPPSKKSKTKRHSRSR